jgi:hypothetical protein
MALLPLIRQEPCQPWSLEKNNGVTGRSAGAEDFSPSRLARVVPWQFGRKTTKLAEFRKMPIVGELKMRKKYKCVKYSVFRSTKMSRKGWGNFNNTKLYQQHT